MSEVELAIADIRAGKMVILVDDEHRENEGDLCLAAEKVTPAAINFMAKFGRGLICVTLTEEQVQRLQLPMMAAPGRSGSPLGTAFTMSVEAREGVTTGISASDRAHTIRVAIDPQTPPEALVVPGHVFPLQARRGGVLVRAGQTEGSVDLARLAGLNPAGVICEIINDDGAMARMADLEHFALQHELRILAIADLISYRLEREVLVERTAEARVRLAQSRSEWNLISYRSVIDGQELLALVLGEPGPEESALCRMHSGAWLDELFGVSSQESAGSNLPAAVAAIETRGAGVIVYLPPRGELFRELEALSQLSATAQRAEKSSPVASPFGARAQVAPLREYGLGAQVLRELGLRRIELLTNKPRPIAALQGYGLELVGTQPLSKAH